MKLPVSSEEKTDSAMPTDGGDQDGHFFYSHPERRGGGYFAA